jgi:1-acyl-sn-glycerol-3-phosphate acyltransferase
VNLVRSLLYTLVFYLGSIPYVVASFLAIPFGQPAILGPPRAWAWFHYQCVRWLLGIRIVVDGELPQTGAIVAFKHESMLETIEVLRLFDRPAVVFKAELLKIPLWGSAALAHGVIPVARETGATALRRMLKAGRHAIGDGRPVIIFPEGTRVPHGDHAPLRPGIAGLYKALGIPIVPVAVDSGRVWPRKGFVKRPGIVTFRVGMPIPTGLARDDVETRVHAGINALNL